MTTTVSRSLREQLQNRDQLTDQRRHPRRRAARAGFSLVDRLRQTAGTTPSLPTATGSQPLTPTPFPPGSYTPGMLGRDSSLPPAETGRPAEQGVPSPPAPVGSVAGRLGGGAPLAPGLGAAQQQQNPGGSLSNIIQVFDEVASRQPMSGGGAPQPTSNLPSLEEAQEMLDRADALGAPPEQRQRLQDAYDFKARQGGVGGNSASPASPASPASIPTPIADRILAGEPGPAPFTGSTAPFSDSELDAGTAAFRGRRSARDRMMGMNVGRWATGEAAHPMMPGVPMGQVDPNYGGIGEKAKWYTDRENEANEPYDPQTEERTQGLQNLAGTNRSVASQMGMTLVGERLPIRNDTDQRIQDLKDIGGLRGAHDAGLLDSFVNVGETQVTPERQREMKEKRRVERAEHRERQAERKLAAKANVISGGIAKGKARKERMERRRMGPSAVEQIMAAASQGSSEAMKMLDMMSNERIAQGGYVGLGEQRKSAAGRDDAETRLLEKKLRLLDDRATQVRAYAAELVAGGASEEDAYEMAERRIPKKEGVASESSGIPRHFIGDDGTAKPPQDIVNIGRAQGMSDEEIDEILAQVHPGETVASVTRTWGEFFGGSSSSGSGPTSGMEAVPSPMDDPMLAPTPTPRRRRKKSLLDHQNEGGSVWSWMDSHLRGIPAPRFPGGSY